MIAQLAMDLPKGYEVEQPAPPAADELVTITYDEMMAWAERLASRGDFHFAIWVSTMCKSAELDAVPLRLPRSLAERLELVGYERTVV